MTKDDSKISSTIIVVNILLIVINAVIIYYMFEVTKSECNCTKDWRELYVKIFSGILIIISMIKLYLHRHNIFHILLKYIIIIGTGVNIYALFTYLGDLNKQNCKCAVENNEIINDFLMIWRWVIAVTYALMILISLLIMLKKN
jgi:hypothetical protein